MHKPFAAVEFLSCVDTAWVRDYTGEPVFGMNRAVDIVHDQFGNCYVTGYVASAESGSDFYTIKYNSSGSPIWSANYDGKTGDDKPVDMCRDAAGNIYVTGISGKDMATVKYNHAGALQWASRYVCPANAYGTVAGIGVDASGNSYIAGSIEISNTRMFFLIIKYDPDGVEVWTAQYEVQWGADNIVAGIVVDDSSNIVLSGSYCSTDEGIPDKDYLTLKYNSDGVLQWAVRFDGPGKNQDEPAALGFDAAGNIYVTGSSMFASGDGSCYATVKYDPLGNQKWSTVYDSPQNTSGVDWSYATALAVDDSGNVYVTGESIGDASYSDYATIKYNALGEEQWLARYNGPANSTDRATALALDESGYVYVTGKSMGSDTAEDFATIKYDHHGVEQWIARYSGPDSAGDIPTAIAVDETGMVYVTGAGDIHYSWGMPYELNSTYTTINYHSAGDEQWVARHDGPGYPATSASGMVIDGDGNVYVTGSCPGYMTGSCPDDFKQTRNSIDYITLKYDADGSVLWAARCVEGGQATHVALDNLGNIYVTGFGDDGGYLTVKYTPTGHQLWKAYCNRPVVGGSGWPGFPWQISLAVDSSGNVYVAGGVDITCDNSDYIVIKYDSDGLEQWQVTYDGPGHFFDEANALAVDDSGNVYVTGKSYGAGTSADIATIKYSAEGIVRWRARYNGSADSWDEGADLAVDDSGNVSVTGRTRSLSTGEDFVTIQYDAAGTMRWISHYNGTRNSWDVATALALDDAGNVVVTGMSNEYGDYTTIKYDHSGTQQWIAQYSNSSGRSYDYPYALAIDRSGNVYVTGFTVGMRDDTDIATIKYSPSGAEEWNAQYNGPGNSHDEAWSIAVDATGQVYVAGTCSGNNWRLMTLIKYRQSSTFVEPPTSKSVIRDFYLLQNYPNPFNSTTTIEFTLPQPTFVTLKVYNLLGEEVATLVTEKRETGLHRMNWNARGLASGIYLYLLQTEDSIRSKKLLLIR